MEQSIVEWILAVVGSGGIGAAITYICTFKSKKKLIEAEAETATVQAEHKKLDLQQDQYDYLQKTCDRYIKDYHELEGDFRRQLSELREQIDKISLEKSQAIQTKCSEIAELKAKVTYLNGIRCYNFICKDRILHNPEKSNQ